MKKSNEFYKDVYMLFVDFKQAYVQLGVPTKRWIYIYIYISIGWWKRVCETQGTKKFNSAISEKFTVTTGIRQGYATSLVLFNIELESIVRELL